MPTLSDLLRSGYTPPAESPMTDALANHLKSIPQKFEENQAHQMSLLNQAFPGNTYESMMTQGDPKAMAELAMQAPFGAMVAYHGTPHTIQGKFDISKVGTGEGAQSYGHGMYFAEEPLVATGYKDALGKEVLIGNKLLVKANRLVGTTKNQDLDKYLRSYEGDVSGIKNTLTKTINDFSEQGKNSLSSYYQNILNNLEKIAPKVKVKDTGNLYKVDIPDEYIPNMLDWDKPINKQTEQIQQIINNIPYSKNIDKNMKGKHFLDLIERQMSQFPDIEFLKEPVKASQYLNELGIKGIRYLDEGSRGVGKGTSNFVVFDPSEVKILEKNSKPVSRKELIEEQVKKLKD